MSQSLPPPDPKDSLSLLKDQKAWLYFGAAFFYTLAAVPELPWYYRMVCAAVANGALAVKAYNSPNADQKPADQPKPNS